MARTGKIGIDYWSHDSDMSSDRKMRIIMAKHGIAGYGFFNLLLDRIFADKGYYLQLDDDFDILFSNDCNLDLNAYNLILNDCIDKELFNKEMYERYNILTSKRIQQTYCDACQRRKDVFFIEAYMLLDAEKEFPEKVNVNIEGNIVDINGENVNISKQSKVKEKESKKKEKKYTARDARFVCEEFDWLDNEIWNEWIDYKQRKKFPITERAINANIKKLQRLGVENASKIIEQSLEEEWKGLFELKQEANKPAAKPNAFLAACEREENERRRN